MTTINLNNNQLDSFIQEQIEELLKNNKFDKKESNKTNIEVLFNALNVDNLQFKIPQEKTIYKDFDKKAWIDKFIDNSLNSFDVDSKNFYIEKVKNLLDNKDIEIYYNLQKNGSGFYSFDFK